MSRVHALITAAGSSSRMGGIDKLTLPIDGIPLLVRTLRPFLSFDLMGSLVVTVNPERVDDVQALLRSHLPSEMKRLHVVAGGIHRQQSILYGLRVLRDVAADASTEPVMIHDGARPFVTSQLFHRLLEGLAEFDGVIPALPVRDTVKRIRDQEVLGTEDRETLRMVQTPQVFGLQPILELHEKAAKEDFVGTDDASLLEKYGRRVGWVQGPVYNLKVTVPEDVAMLSHLFGQTAAETAHQ